MFWKATGHARVRLSSRYRPRPRHPSQPLCQNSTEFLQNRYRRGTLLRTSPSSRARPRPTPPPPRSQRHRPARPVGQASGETSRALCVKKETRLFFARRRRRRRRLGRPVRLEAVALGVAQRLSCRKQARAYEGRVFCLSRARARRKRPTPGFPRAPSAFLRAEWDFGSSSEIARGQHERDRSHFGRRPISPTCQNPTEFPPGAGASPGAPRGSPARPPPDPAPTPAPRDCETPLKVLSVFRGQGAPFEIERGHHLFFSLPQKARFLSRRRGSVAARRSGRRATCVPECRTDDQKDALRARSGLAGVCSLHSSERDPKRTRALPETQRFSSSCPRPSRPRRRAACHTGCARSPSMSSGQPRCQFELDSGGESSRPLSRRSHHPRTRDMSSSPSF